jgi:hypothetical protein
MGLERRGDRVSREPWGNPRGEEPAGASHTVPDCHACSPGGVEARHSRPGRGWRRGPGERGVCEGPPAQPLYARASGVRGEGRPAPGAAGRDPDGRGPREAARPADGGGSARPDGGHAVRGAGGGAGLSPRVRWGAAGEGGAGGRRSGARARRARRLGARARPPRRCCPHRPRAWEAGGAAAHRQPLGGVGQRAVAESPRADGRRHPGRAGAGAATRRGREPAAGPSRRAVDGRWGAAAASPGEPRRPRCRGGGGPLSAGGPGAAATPGAGAAGC